MEDSFNVRVNKVFGSLPTSSPAPSSSLWCLTDEEIEKREWNRNKGSPIDDDEPKPYPKNLDGFANQSAGGLEYKTSDLLEELEEESEDEEDEEDKKDLIEREVGKPDDYVAWCIRSSIGKDCTLDNEEEEDEFDQVAIGREEALDSLYQRDITDYEADIKSYSELPNTFRDVNKDPRANRRAAEIRLQEDAGVADIDYMQTSKTPHPAPNIQNDISKESVALNSILKSKGNHVDTKSKKRVRFDSSVKDDECEKNSEESNILALETSLGLNKSESVPKESSNVPDYVRNPSKYKHYTFDPSPDVDDASNHRAYADFLKLVKQPDQMESQDCHPFELPKSVIFTPKKKPGENTVGIIRNESEQNQSKSLLPIAMAAEDELGNGICAMEEDEHEAADDRIKSSQKAVRRFRTKDSE